MYLPPLPIEMCSYVLLDSKYRDPYEQNTITVPGTKQMSAK